MRVWTGLESEYGRAALIFPREIIWLGGAPGAGKGVNASYIMEARDITAPPIVTSSLLNSPRARQIKDAGGLVGDEEVVDILLRTLLNPLYAEGIIVDGFPRTKVQVECLKMFYDRMIALMEEFRPTPRAGQFRQPLFRIVLLFVDEETSVERQLQRGREAQEHNRRVRESGVGSLEEIRPTDLEPEAARERYRLFKETTFEVLQSLGKIFHFHFIDAHGPLEEVQHNIQREFTYQSSLELAPETFDRIRRIPPAARIVVHARQELVKRLDGYNQNQPEVFERVLCLIEKKFMPIIERYAITGMTLINSEDPVFEQPEALAMLIDIFSERGYQALADVNRIDVPRRFDPRTHQILCEQKRVYRFQIRFQPSAIHRGHDWAGPGGRAGGPG